MRQICALFFILFIFRIQSVEAQIIELAFTELRNGTYAQIDSVKVTNLTQGSDTTLYWPDTTLMIVNVGLQQQIEANNGGFSMILAGNNPVADACTINMYVPEDDEVDIMVSDLLGRQKILFSKQLPRGFHAFRFIPGKDKFYVIESRWRASRSTLKIINIGFNGSTSSVLEYLGAKGENTYLNFPKSSNSFFFTQGDLLKLTGYDIGISTIITTTVQSSQVYTFSFGANFPCMGVPFFSYGGQTYNTVKIGGQCWMKENLNIGNMITSTQSTVSHTDCNPNITIEKYCINNDPANCAIYGGLYDWNEMMEYKPENQKGICPIGWHVPTNTDWCILTTYLDSTVNCVIPGWSGTSIAGLLKEPGLMHWISTSADINNQSGFTALGAGYRTMYGYFGYFLVYSQFWTSTETSSTSALYRSICFNASQIGRNSSTKTYGYSVRCIKDN